MRSLRLVHGGRRQARERQCSPFEPWSLEDAAWRVIDAWDFPLDPLHLEDSIAELRDIVRARAGEA